MHIEVLADTNSGNSGSVGSGTSGYVIGSPLTNWEDYRILCTFTDKISVIPLIYDHSRTYQAYKDVCGKGSGLCWRLTGC